jgi:hypothetical protein
VGKGPGRWNQPEPLLYSSVSVKLTQECRVRVFVLSMGDNSYKVALLHIVRLVIDSTLTESTQSIHQSLAWQILDHLMDIPGL